MKTFETEKHWMPQDATHYSSETDVRYFSWFKKVGDSEWYVQIKSDNGKWVPCEHLEHEKSGVIEINIAINSDFNIDTIATQTPEEKEALDRINPREIGQDPASRNFRSDLNELIKGAELDKNGVAVSFDMPSHMPAQVEVSKLSMSNPTLESALKSIDELDKFDDLYKLQRTQLHKAADKAEWNGEGLPPVGWRGLSSYTEPDGDNWCDFHDGVVMGVNGDYVWMAHHGKFQRVHHVGNIEFKEPESPEEKEKRERLEAAYDLYCHVSNKANRGTYTFEQFCDESLTDYKIDYLAIVDKTNYRKGE